MTPQEKDLLTRFLLLLASAQAGHKDAEAEALIREACARQPDAAYLLVQRAIQLEQLLHASQTEVERLKSELDRLKSQEGQASAPSGSFLGDPYAWGKSTATSSPAQTSAGFRAIPGTRGPGAAPAYAAAAPAAAPQASSWGSGLFGNIAATAAGVVAGSFLFQGIESLMHRGEHQPDQHAFGDITQPFAHEGEPELLNSFDTPLDDSGDTFAAGDDSGDLG